MKNQPPSWSYPSTKYREFKKTTDFNPTPMGGGRSYGDANFVGKVFGARKHSSILEFDPITQIATFGSGVSIQESLNFLLLWGKTLPIIPGTSNATIGGCIASDIHGKNSHKLGSFSSHVKSFELKLNNGLRLEVNDPNSPAWKVTVGGQGLTGEILSARIKVIDIYSTRLHSTIVATKDLEDLFSKIDSRKDQFDYLVGWVDGESNSHAESGYIEFCKDVKDSNQKDNIKGLELYKRFFPKVKIVNRATILLFNLIKHYQIKKHLGSTKEVDRWNYMFPLASMGHWNHFFGRNGYHEIQFSCSDRNLGKAILLLRKIIKEQTIFLIGVKVMNETQTGYLAFPGQKWSIAIDFTANVSTESAVRTYYDEIIGFEGKINLTKDWVLDPEQFRKIFKDYKEISAWRACHNIDTVSNFSKRVDVDNENTPL